MVFDNTESAPLLGSTFTTDNSFESKWNNFKRQAVRNKLHVYVPIGIISVILFSLIAIFFTHVKPNLGVGVAEGTVFDTDNLRLLGLGDSGGIDLQISGTNTNNYTNIDDSWIRNYFKAGGFTLRGLNLKIDDLDLIVHEGDEKLNLGKAAIKPFYVKIANNKSTPMDLFITLYPNGKGVKSILKKVLLEKDPKLRLTGDANVKVYILGGFLPVSSISVPLDVEF